jgi:hypothetical protein
MLDDIIDNEGKIILPKTVYKNKNQIDLLIEKIDILSIEELKILYKHIDNLLWKKMNIELKENLFLTKKEL